MEFKSFTFFIFRLLQLPLLLLCFSSPVSSATDSVTFNINSGAALLNDSGGETLVSAWGTFQFGFFSPNGSDRRYLGVWYRNWTSTVVWVANRKEGLQFRSGFLSFATGRELQLVDGANLQAYWSIPLSGSDNYSLKLYDSGNLIVSGERSSAVVWQSFDNPTDTFLSGMKMVPGLNLSSWTSPNDPSPGNYIFQLDQDSSGNQQQQFEILNNSKSFWTSSGGQTSQVPQFISDCLTNHSRENSTFGNITIYPTKDYTKSRILMGFDGRIQFFQSPDETAPSWVEPFDICDTTAPCGKFGSCNRWHRWPCKCLPGFVPKWPQKWLSGDFSDGCTSSSLENCENVSTTFANLAVAKVRRCSIEFEYPKLDNEAKCRESCTTCKCQAYSFREAVKKDAGWCRIWEGDDLKDIEEAELFDESIFRLSVRVPLPETGGTKMDCNPCGTNIVPYPLSTQPNCGDPRYSGFLCFNETGQLFFEMRNAYYTVTRVEKQSHRFFVRVSNESCGENETKEVSVTWNESLPFKVQDDGCSGNTDNVYSGPFHNGSLYNEMAIVWDLPSEPLCSSDEDCKDWPNSSCRPDKSGEKRCFCNRNSTWDGINATCSQAVGLFSNGGSSPSSSKGTRESMIRIIVGSLGGVFLLSCLAIVIIMYKRRTGRKIARKEGKDGENLALRMYDSEKRVKEFINSGEFGEDDKRDINVPFFDMDCILAATDSFSVDNKLGQGGFGPVYKGKFPGGQEIAVKRLSSASAQGLEEFKNEVVLIAKLQHKNLVRLLGYCVEGDEKILLYEYMPNKSLDFFIFDRDRCMLLDWGMRFNIIMGIARGLLYLHHDSRLTIIHRDLKTGNILLDGEMNPRISDFGMARIMGVKETEANTVKVVGTYGYMSPEYALDGTFSIKSDVFSFGVVLLEILCGKRNTGFYKTNKIVSLLGHVWGCWREEKAMEVMEPSLSETCVANEFLKCMNVALLCVQEDPSDRPTMSHVVFMLGSETASLPRPKEPAFSTRQQDSSTSTSIAAMDTTTDLEAR